MNSPIGGCKPGWHGSVQFEFAEHVGWDQRRFAAPAHHDFPLRRDGGPALEASWSHPTLFGKSRGRAGIANCTHPDRPIASCG